MEKIKKSKFKLIYYVTTIILLIIFINRLRYTISVFDEVSNVALAYKVFLGQMPLTEIWEFQQMGAIFNVPFIFLYKLLKGNTEGLILFLRVSYLLLNIVISFMVSKLLKDFVIKENRLILSLAIITYAPFSLYYIWYDTAAILFMISGATFLILANRKSGIRKDVNYLLAGISHALMCFAYPSFIVVVIFYLFYLLFYVEKGSLWNKILVLKGYIIGGGIIAFTFILYLLLARERIFFFDKSIVATGMAGREYTIISRICGIIWGSFVFFKPLILPIIILLYIYVNCVKSKNNKKLKVILLIGIALVPYITLKKMGSLSTFLYFFYLFLWAPLLYRLLPEEIKKIGHQFLIYLWLPSILSFFAVGFTANGGGVKSAFGTYTGAICSLLFITIIINDIIKNTDKLLILKCLCSLFVISLFSIINIALYYNTGFEDQNMKTSNYKIEKGIFKGIYAKDTDKFYVELEDLVKKNCDENDKSIFFTDNMQAGYLFTELIPAEAHIWDHYIEQNEQTGEWQNALTYFERVTGLPSIIVSRTELIAYKPNEFQNLISNNYYIAEQTDKVTIFRLKKIY